MPRQVSRSEAEAFFGQRMAREALKINPADVSAQVVLVSQALEKAVEKVGFKAVTTNDPTGAFASALAAGPNVLGPVIQTAINDRQDGPGRGGVDSPGADCRPRRPVLGKSGQSPGRGTRLARSADPVRRRAALVLLEPRRCSRLGSRVVPILARFVANQPAARAVVIDGNLDRGNLLGSLLKELGYVPTSLAPARRASRPRRRGPTSS